MRTVQVGDKPDQKVLISRYQGKLYATSNACSHFGVPLEGGMLFDDKVLCPAHAAAFSVVTGEPERAPGLNGIPIFPVIEKEGKFFVEIPAGGLPASTPVKLAKRDANNTQRFVIIGGGAAGLNAAETLRQSGFTGQVTLISNEDIPPYDRTLITKALTKGNANAWQLRPAEYLAEADIDIHLNSSVKSVNSEQKLVELANGESISFDKLLIASGSSVNKPNILGVDAKNVHFVRSNNDQKTIKEKCQNATNIVVVGSSFIGCETASCLGLDFGKDASKKIHLISRSSVPLERQLGQAIGSVYKKEHESNGVKVHSNVEVTAIKTDGENKVQSVILSDGTELSADLVIMGLGVHPNTEFLKGSGVQLATDGGVICDPFLQTSVKDIYAAGDIASYPYWPTGGRVRTEHWVTALDQGSFAAFNMLNKYVPYGEIPFFWTRQHNKSLMFIGDNTGYADIYISGDLENQKFVAYYIDKDDKVIACAGMAQSKPMLTYLEAMKQGVMPRGSDIKSGAESWETVAAKLRMNVGGARCKRANCCQKKSVE